MNMKLIPLIIATLFLCTVCVLLIFSRNGLTNKLILSNKKVDSLAIINSVKDSILDGKLRKLDSSLAALDSTIANTVQPKILNNIVRVKELITDSTTLRALDELVASFNEKDSLRVASIDSLKKQVVLLEIRMAEKISFENNLNTLRNDLYKRLSEINNLSTGSKVLRLVETGLLVYVAVKQ